jgi:hypothetical protein
LVSDTPAGDGKIAIFFTVYEENFILFFISACCLTDNDDIVHGLEDDGEDEGDDGGQVHHVHPVPHELHLHRANTENRKVREEYMQRKIQGPTPSLIFKGSLTLNF